MTKLNLDLVTAFRAVAEQLHFGRAAKRLHVSQSALTTQIQKLESVLNVQLFERDRRSVRLTQAGLVLLAGATDLLLHADTLADQIRGTQTAPAAPILRVGFVSTASVEILPGVVRMFRQQRPDVQLVLRNLITMEQLVALDNGDLDAGSLRLPTCKKTVRTLLVQEESFCLLIPKGHRFQKLQAVPLAEALKEPQVIYAREGAPGYYEQMMNLLLSDGGFQMPAQEARDMYSITALVASGFGVAIVPRSVGRHRLPGTVVKSLTGRLPKAQIGLAIKRQAGIRSAESTKTPRGDSGLKTLIDVCRLAFKGL